MTEQDWISSHEQNVFEMADAHGGPGFWLRRTTWSSSIARVVRIGELTGPPPYYGNPSVLMDVYSLGGSLAGGPDQLPAAGTYKTWRMIDPPSWAATASLRSLDDPALDEALAKLDRKRGKAKLPQPQQQRLWLTVDYEQIDTAKELGARWAPGERRWWLPADAHQLTLERARKFGFLS